MKELSYPPTPMDDRVNGRNGNVYLKANEHPTKEEQEAFVNEIKSYVIPLAREAGIPASVIVAMACVESGYGFTRIAHYANNLFAIKDWRGDDYPAWQLKGQPDENDGKVKIIEDLGYDRKIFDESSRPDNWYIKFNSRQDAVKHLINKVLLKDDYRPARDQYQDRIHKENWALPEAARKYAYRIAELGYYHLKSHDYEKLIGQMIERWNLSTLDLPDAQQTVEPTEQPAATPETVSASSTTDNDILNTLSKRVIKVVREVATNVTGDAAQEVVESMDPEVARRVAEGVTDSIPNATRSDASSTSGSSFKMKYEIQKDYLAKGSKRRSGRLMEKVQFVVAHDTGNPNAGAQNHVNYFRETQQTEVASAHTFIDDREIIECIPTGLSGDPAEQAQHVMNSKPTDNRIFAGDANHVAIGVELCYGQDNSGRKIDPEEAYRRYVWYLAYTCYRYKLNPSWDVVGHHILDPQRKSDPENALKVMGKSYPQLLKDVAHEYRECTTPLPKPTEYLLQTGSTGFDVQKLQENLAFLGYKIGSLDGDFGPKTTEAVKEFQSKMGLKVDGVVGPATEYKIQEQLANLCLKGKC